MKDNGLKIKKNGYSSVCVIAVMDGRKNFLRCYEEVLFPEDYGANNKEREKSGLPYEGRKP